jgi:hypothetical protein
MLRHIAIAATVLAAAAPLAAQRSEAVAARAKVAHVTPYVGYMRFGSFINGPLGTSVRNANGPVYGAQLGLKMTPNLALIGNVAYSSSNLEIGVPILGGIDVGESSLLLYDASVEYGIPVSSGSAGGTSITPFVQAGAGAFTAKLSNSLVNVDATSFAANAGVGADVSFGPSLGLRVMAKDYFGKFDFKEVAGFDINNDWSHNVAFSAGLRLSF